MKDFPDLISVIIPVCNVQKYLRRCLDSIEAQTYKNLEIIIIDDGSVDDTGKICDEYAAKDNRIQVIHQSHQELPITRNTGLNLAHGKYIATADGDDYIEPDTYEYLYGLITKDNADVAMCNVCEDEGFKSKHPIQEKYKLIPMSEITKSSDWMFLWNKLFSARAIKDIQFNPKAAIRSDELFMFEVIKKSNLKVALGNEKKYHYCQIAGSNTYRFKPVYLQTVPCLEEYVKYAKEHHMTDVYPVRYYALCNIMSSWLLFLALSSDPNPEQVRAVKQHIRKHLAGLLRANTIPVKKKLFTLAGLVNFKMTQKAVKRYHKHKK